LEGLKKFVNDDETGWKLTLNKDQNPAYLDSKVKVWYEKGAKDFNEFAEVKDVEMEDAEAKIDTKHDADSTVVQENNDTTIQQDANDTTADETTVNQDDATIIADTQIEPTDLKKDWATRILELLGADCSWFHGIFDLLCYFF